MTTSNMNFGPEWMRKLSSPNSNQNLEGDQIINSDQDGSNAQNNLTSYSSITGKNKEDSFKLENNNLDDSLNPFKYSKEFMLSLYKEVSAPLDFQKHEYVSVDECLPPVDHFPLTELEQRLLASGHINSSATRRNTQPYGTQNQNARNVDRTNRNAASNRGRVPGTNYSTRNTGNMNGGMWANVSKSSVGTFGNDGVFMMEGAGDSLESSEFAMTAEMFEAERRAYHRNNKSNLSGGELSQNFGDYQDYETNQGRGGRGSLKNILVGLPGADEPDDIGFNPDDVSNWYYNDPTGVTQGPFTGFEMHDWYIAGYFQGDLLVRRETDSSFEPLAHLISRVGDEDKPFLTPPRSSHLRTILTPRSARFNFSGYEPEPENSYGSFVQPQQTFGNFMSGGGLESNIMGHSQDLHQQRLMNGHFAAALANNPYQDAAFYQAQQERQLYLQQQMAQQQYAMNPYSQMHSTVQSNETPNQYPQNAWNTQQSVNNNQLQGDLIANNSQTSPTENEEGKIEEEKVVSDLNNLSLDGPKQNKNESAPQSNETKPKTNKAKNALTLEGKQVKSGSKKGSNQTSPKVPFPTTPAPWQGSSKPTKSLREIQQEEEAEAKNRSLNQANELPKRYADTLAKKAGAGWNSNAQTTPVIKTSANSGSSTSQNDKKDKSKGTGTPPQPSDKFINWAKLMLRSFVGINADELINMLLSFPLDPTPQFKEIVKDMFLEQQNKGNRQVVDFKKFAEEFTIRRKVDCGLLPTSALPNPPLKAPAMSKSEPVESFQVVGKKNRKRS